METDELVRNVRDTLRKTGDELRALWESGRKPKGAEEKAANDYVTEWDRRVQAKLREELARLAPRIGFLGEEDGTAAGGAEGRWILDPIDGTTNLMHGLPHWSISLALEHDGAVIAGWVYDVLRDELFEARAGKGAWLNERPIRVSGVDRMERALVAIGTPVQKSDADGLWPVIQLVFTQCQDIRRCGSAAIDLAWTAAGRFDGYLERKLHVWDWAAGFLLVREAGGIVTGWDGAEVMTTAGAPDPTGIVASNGRIHAELLKAAR